LQLNPLRIDEELKLVSTGSSRAGLDLALHYLSNDSPPATDRPFVVQIVQPVVRQRFGGLLTGV
jgi:hypothetical protein